MMASSWYEVFLRIPFVFLLDFSVTFLPDHLQHSVFIVTAVQATCILLSFLIVIASAEQLYMIYYIAMLVVDLSLVLYLNVYNTLELLADIKSAKTVWGLSNPTLTVPVIAISWLVFIASIFMYARAFHSLKPLWVSACLVPIFARHVTDSDSPPSLSTTCCFGLTVFIVLQTLYGSMWQLFELLRTQIQILTIRLRMYGFIVVFILHWRRVRFSKVLSIYWLLMWNYNLCIMSIFMQDRFQASFLLACCSYTCNSFIKVASFCYVIQHVVRAILDIVHYYVKDDHTLIDEGMPRPTGLRESLGFLFLSLYTNLTSTDASKRMILLELILLLLLSALMRSIFEVVEPYLLALSTAVHSRSRHLRLVSLCLVLLLAAVLMGFYLYSLREKIPFSIPNIITVAQILCALLLYVLYMYDSQRGDIWEGLDDYVYYIKGTCRSFEFVLVVVVLGYRVLDTTSKWTIFQIAMVILHLYVNVYLTLRDGWQSLKLRRLVNRKLNVLPHASTERLSSVGDVCSICLEELKSARVTPCNHLFHTPCLKKWLNVQNKCPMCHATILFNS